MDGKGHVQCGLARKNELEESLDVVFFTLSANWATVFVHKRLGQNSGGLAVVGGGHIAHT